MSELRDLFDELRDVDNMICKPTFKRLKANEILDEDKSVRWNREQVQKNHEEYDKEVIRLNTVKNKARDNVLSEIYKEIQSNVTGLSEKGAKAIYRYAYEQGHFCGYNKVADYITDLYELAEQILN